MELMVVIVWLASIALSVSAAGNKGLNGFAWGMLALFFGPLALLVVLLWPNSDANRLRRGLVNGTHRACPKCFSAIDSRATVCPHCQSAIGDEEPVSPKAPNPFMPDAKVPD